MRTVVFGATGAIGRAISAELTARGHEVTGAARDGLAAAADAADPAAVAALVAGQDAVVSAVGPRAGRDDPGPSLLAAISGLTEGLRAAGVRRLVVVGGAGSLELVPGQRLVDTPGFPAAARPVALAHAQVLEFLRSVADLDWTYCSPAAVIEPGERTGTFRLGGDQLLTGTDGISRISIPDFAVAVADEIELGTAIRRRITVAY